MPKTDKIYEQKMKLLLNQPTLLKHYLQRNQSPISKGDKLRSIFPPSPQLQRFRHLQHARLSAQRDLELDGCVLDVIRKFEQQVSKNTQIDKELQITKQNCLKKLKMDYVQQQMTQNLHELETLLKQFVQFSDLIEEQKGYVQKMIIITQIKRALTVQNGILKKQNQVFKKQQEQLDILVNNRKKK